MVNRMKFFKDCFKIRKNLIEFEIYLGMYLRKVEWYLVVMIILVKDLKS